MVRLIKRVWVRWFGDGRVPDCPNIPPPPPAKTGALELAPGKLLKFSECTAEQGKTLEVPIDLWAMTAAVPGKGVVRVDVTVHGLDEAMRKQMRWLN